MVAWITSKPLFISVAESTVMRPPISHVGWASASSGVVAVRPSMDRRTRSPPGDPPSPVPRRAGADEGRSLGVGGTRRASPPSARAVAHSPPGRSGSLLARPGRAGAERDDRRTQPGNPTIAVSGGGLAAMRSRTPASPARTRVSEPRSLVGFSAASGRGRGDLGDAVLARLLRGRCQRWPAERPQSSRSSEAGGASACSPIDPVDPRMRTSWACAGVQGRPFRGLRAQ